MARFSDFPEGVLEEITSWLPPQSLKQFKCVCKSWYFHISALMNNPEFVAKHLCNMKNKSLSYPLLHFRNLLTIKSPEVPYNSLEGTYLLTVATADSCSVTDHIPCVIEDLKLLTSGHFDASFRMVSLCNGIICFYDYTSRKEKNILFLLNHAIRELKAVPDAHFGDGYEIRGVGFGYDSKANDYKVVPSSPRGRLNPVLEKLSPES